MKKMKIKMKIRYSSQEEGTATHSSILVWRISMDRGTWRATVHGVTSSWTPLKLLNMHAHDILLHPSESLKLKRVTMEVTRK